MIFIVHVECIICDGIFDWRWRPNRRHVTDTTYYIIINIIIKHRVCILMLRQVLAQDYKHEHEYDVNAIGCGFDFSSRKWNIKYYFCSSLVSSKAFTSTIERKTSNKHYLVLFINMIKKILLKWHVSRNINTESLFLQTFGNFSLRANWLLLSTTL